MIVLVVLRLRYQTNRKTLTLDKPRDQCMTKRRMIDVCVRGDHYEIGYSVKFFSKDGQKTHKKILTQSGIFDKCVNNRKIIILLIMKNKVLKRILFGVLLFFVISVIFTFSAVSIVTADATLDRDKITQVNGSITILDINGKEISQNQDHVDLKDVCDDLKNAFVAVEDKRFYSHNGLDYRRIISSALHDIKKGNFSQGASTITCQLAKNTHLNGEKSLKRKLKEAKIALQIEKEYTKDEILEAYLNVIYFGNGIYGIGNASKRFFDKTPNELSLSECASIAATVANPAKYSPLNSLENNTSRRNVVLKLMREQGFADTKEYEQAVNSKVEIKTTNDYCEKYVDEAVKQAKAILGVGDYDLKMRDLTIKTYCVQEEQKRACDSLNKNDSKADKSLLITDTNSGGITAYASNHSYSPFTLKRQVGSLLKPFITTIAFENSLLLPASILDDKEITINGYSPKNYSGVYRGKISVRDAIAYSSNSCAVQILDMVGVDKCIEYFDKIGIDFKEDRNLALALGGTKDGLSLSQIAMLYGVFSTNQAKEPSFIYEIRDKDEIIYKNETSNEKLFSAESIAYINDCLEYTTKIGTAKKLKDTGLCAKTGTVETTKGNSDAWSVAYDSTRVYLSWMGNLSMKKDKMLTQTGGGEPTLTLKNAITKPIYPTNKNAKKGYLDKLSLERDGVLRLASFNTPKRYTIYDYVGKVKEISTYFTDPKVNWDASVENDKLIVKIKGQKENSFLVNVNSFNGSYSRYLSEENDYDIIFDDLEGLVELKITPFSNGLTTAVGKTVEKRFWIEDKRYIE